jgi:hypothetical protein
VEGEDAPAGARAQLDAELLQRGVDPELAQLGVLLQPSHGGHRPQISLERAPVPRVRRVAESSEARVPPASPRRVDRVPVHLQVAGDAADRPALRVQVDDRQPRLARVRDLGVRRVAPGDRARRQQPREDVGDRPGAGALAELGEADPRDPVGAERRVLGVERGRTGPPRRVGLGASKPLRPVSSNSRAARQIALSD